MHNLLLFLFSDNGHARSLYTRRIHFIDVLNREAIVLGVHKDPRPPEALSPQFPSLSIIQLISFLIIMPPKKSKAPSARRAEELTDINRYIRAAWASFEPFRTSSIEDITQRRLKALFGEIHNHMVSLCLSYLDHDLLTVSILLRCPI